MLDFLQLFSDFNFHNFYAKIQTLRLTQNLKFRFVKRKGGKLLFGLENSNRRKFQGFKTVCTILQHIVFYRVFFAYLRKIGTESTKKLISKGGQKQFFDREYAIRGPSFSLI